MLAWRCTVVVFVCVLSLPFCDGSGCAALNTEGVAHGSCEWKLNWTRKIGGMLVTKYRCDVACDPDALLLRDGVCVSLQNSSGNVTYNVIKKPACYKGVVPVCPLPAPPDADSPACKWEFASESPNEFPQQNCMPYCPSETSCRIVPPAGFGLHCESQDIISGDCQNGTKMQRCTDDFASQATCENGQVAPSSLEPVERCLQGACLLPPPSAGRPACREGEQLNVSDVCTPVCGPGLIVSGLRYHGANVFRCQLGGSIVMLPPITSYPVDFDSLSCDEALTTSTTEAPSPRGFSPWVWAVIAACVLIGTAGTVFVIVVKCRSQHEYLSEPHRETQV